MQDLPTIQEALAELGLTLRGDYTVVDLGDGTAELVIVSHTRAFTARLGSHSAWTLRGAARPGTSALAFVRTTRARSSWRVAALR